MFLGITRPPSMGFTEQEKVILSMLARGYSNDVIMDNLYISRNTVKTHMRNIFSKLEVTDRTQAAVWAVRRGYDKN